MEITLLVCMNIGIISLSLIVGLEKIAKDYLDIQANAMSNQRSKDSKLCCSFHCTSHSEE